MAKITWKAGTMLSPLPPALVSCGTIEKPNALTIAWTGIISSSPVMTYVSIRPERHSHDIIKNTGEFVINLPNLALLNATDFCGVKSGKNINKFKEMNLTPAKCSEIDAPQIEEAPVSLECKVVSVANYGSHDMFLAEVKAVNVDDKYIDDKGRLCLEKAGLLAFSHGKYFTLGRELGNMGFSVNKRRLAQMEKMKKIEVTVKHAKFINDGDKNEEKKTPRPVAKKTGKGAKPFVKKEGMERRLAEKLHKSKPDEQKKKTFGAKPRGDKPFAGRTAKPDHDKGKYNNKKKINDRDKRSR